MMNTARSFRQTSGRLPATYRTPSPPPREAIEPLSPGAQVEYSTRVADHNAHNTKGLGLSLDTSNGIQRETSFGQQLWVDGNGQARIDSFIPTPKAHTLNRKADYDDNRVISREEGSHKRDRKGHSRSGSNMDTLASVALATSPTNFSQGSPAYSQSPWPTYANGFGIHHDYNIDEPSPKRARSEKLPSPQMSRRQSRPTTSHVSSERVDEAELLLNLANPKRVAQIGSFTPPRHIQIEQESPSYRRLSTSTTASEQILAPGHDVFGQGGLPSRIPHGEAVPSMRMEQDHGRLLLVRDERYEENEQKSDHGKGWIGGLNNEVPAFPSEIQVTAISTDQLEATFPGGEARTEEKKPRRIQPQTQAPCATCNSLQAALGGESHDRRTSWINCNGCQRWFHIFCAGFKDDREVRDVDKYICPDCEPEKGQSTMVRKSSRAKISIDYAGLHQGMIQAPEETAEHHWLKPIKDGRIKFQPDDFARIRPELLTTEYLEKTDGMKRPVVIPACWNPQFGLGLSDGTSAEKDLKSDGSHRAVDSEGNEVTPDLISIDNGDHADVLDYGQDLMDMVMPQNLTVRRVAELHGPDMPLDVIDVKSQQTAQKWNLKKWADYYESSGEKTIRNVISLEVSQSKLGRLLQRPKIVRELDLQDAVWPLDLPSKAVQFYCLMSVADCYTDFHIDFGGSSVYYHILKGKKTFFFIPPEEKHLKKYEQWNNSPLQNQTFLGNETGDCRRVDLSEGDTMLIPSGWIHAVWTPENSLVIGGNFLTRMSYEMQIKVNRIEIDTKTALKFRYPLFQKVNWYAAISYLEDDPVPEEVSHDFEDDPDHVFLRANPVWHEVGDLANGCEPGDRYYNARFYSRMEVEGLPALRDYLYRTALIASDFHVDGVTETARSNVKKSIPKGHGEPLDLIRRFGIWVAWKTGCVTAPDWVRPDSPSLSSLARKAEKQKKSDPARTPGERASTRVQSQMEQARVEVPKPTESSPQQSSVESEVKREEVKKVKRTPKSSGLGPQRFACDQCRKRRIRCCHKGEVPASTTGSFRARAYSSTGAEMPRPKAAQPVANLEGSPSPSQGRASEPATSSKQVFTPSSAQDINSVNSVNGVNGQSTPVPVQILDLALASTSSGKKGRSKACDDCRRSKRRCIHDESGKIDPSKAAEPAKPRGSSSSKRPARFGDKVQASGKLAQADDGDDTAVGDGKPESPLSETLAEPVMGEEEEEVNALIDPTLRPAIRTLPAATTTTTQSAEEMSQAAEVEASPATDSTNKLAEGPLQANLTIHLDPQPHASSPSIKPEPVVAALVSTSSQISANSLVSPPDSHHNDDDDFPPTMIIPK